MENSDAAGANTGMLDGSVSFQKVRDLKVYTVVANSSGAYAESHKQIYGWFSAAADISPEPAGGGGDPPPGPF